MTKTKIIQFYKMTSQKPQVGKILNFRNSSILHGFFGIIEYTLILITILVYVSNIALLIISNVIIIGLISVLGYAIIFKNPFYYISAVGLACITIFPSAVAIIIFIGSTSWSYEPVKIFVISALIIEILYISLFIMEINHNKYISYYHRKYGNLRQTVVGALYYSVKEFDKLDKGRQFWQDQNPEEAQKKLEELSAYKKKFKKKLLIWVQILSVMGFNIIFGISLLL